MANCAACATCCAVFSVLGIVLLLFFGGLMQQGSIHLRLIAVKNGWDMQEKARACFAAAGIYGVTLVISVLSRICTSGQ